VDSDQTECTRILTTSTDGKEVADQETALHLGVSERAVKDDWRFARAWLMKELGPQDADH